MTVLTKEYLKQYKETVEMIAVLAEKIGWKIAAKDIDIGTGEPGMIMGKGDFTNGGHFIVLTGLTSDGKVIVNDPASVRRSNQTWDLGLIQNQASKAGEFTFWAISK